MTPHILILAAGSSSRMRGGDKLLEPIGAEALLARMARIALATGCAVTVTLPDDRPARAAALQGLAVTCRVVPNARAGMAESLKAGLQALHPDASVLVLLADLPEITTADLLTCLAVWDHWPEAIVQATSADGVPGHPVGFPPDLRPALLALTGDQGARTVLEGHRHRLHRVALPGQHATTDLDTPEDWARWRAAQRS